MRRRLPAELNSTSGGTKGEISVQLRSATGYNDPPSGSPTDIHGTHAGYRVVCDVNMGKKSRSRLEREQLLRAARATMKNAYAPYSKFRVGAAILTSTGDVFVGCNVENASYGMTNCAERTAIFAAVAALGPDIQIQAVAVTNDRGVPCSPCGACRQVIYEFGPQAVVYFQGKKGWKESAITDLLPEGFRLDRSSQKTTPSPARVK